MSKPECEQFSGRLKEICSGTALVDGVPMNPEHVKHFRFLHGIETESAWKPGDKPRGLGDVIATVTHYTGIAKVAEYLYPKTKENPKGCGCHGDDGRQGSINAAFPFKETKWRQ